MSRSHFSLHALSVALLIVAAVAPAHAQATRTWVSGVGDDANPCSRTAPCKTFAGAISKTAAGGEISALDPGGFGAVTINKSITISGDGTLAGILAAGTNGVNVVAGANDVVILRSLSINGAGSGASAIQFSSGRLQVENVSIHGFVNESIDVTSSSARLNVKNTSITGVANSVGILLRVSGIDASLSHVRLEGHAHGLRVQGGVANISNSVITQNGGSGILAEGGAVNVETCTVSGNTIGLQAAGGSIRISNANIFNNYYGIFIGSGTVASFGNNKNSGNSVDGAPNLMFGQQ